MVITRRLLIPALGLSAVVVLNPQLWLWCLAAIVLLVLVDILLAGSPRRLQVQRLEGRAVRVGQTTTATTRLHNLGRRAVRGSLRDGWQPTAGAQDPVQPLRLSPGETSVLQTELSPRRRGNLTSEHLTVRSLGPLGVAGRQVVHRVPHTQRTLPEFASRKHLPSKLQRLRELDGATAVQLRGAGTEFDSLRDYVRGDDVRSIDWRATARRHTQAGQQLVVRTWRPERDRRVVLCLDASRTSAARIADEPRLDTGMEAALLLGVLAHSAGDRVDFLAFHRDLVAQASSSQKGDFLRLASAAMSQVDPALVEADFSQLPSQVTAVAPHRALVVILSTLDSASLQEGLLPVLPALTAKHKVVIATVRDPDLDAQALDRRTVAGAYAASAAERAAIETEALKRELAGFGVDVVEAPPGQLPPALADKYIQLKATGQL